MIITRTATSETVQLEDGFFWSDEFEWNNKEQTVDRAIDGTPHIQEGTKLGARPITLQSADQNRGWVKLRDVRVLKAWSALAEEFRVQFEWPHDTRSFTCIWNHTAAAIEASPILSGPATSLDDYMNLTLRFWSE